MAGLIQVPDHGEIFLDHLGHFVPDMEAAHRDLTRLGFTQTPYTLHRTTPGPGEAATPSGTANRCCMLGEGYLEVLCVSDAATPTGARTQRQLDRYTGLHIVALSTDDAIARSARLQAAGFEPQEPVNLRRPVPLPGGEGNDGESNGGDAMAAFTVCRTPEHTMPEGRVQFLTHLTEDLVWQPRWTTHENGIVGLRDVMVVPRDVEEAADRYARFCDRVPVRIGAGMIRVALDRGGVVLATPEAAAETIPGLVVPSVPFIGAYGLLTEDLAATRAFLEGRGFAPSPIGEGVLALTLPASLGGTWLLAEDERHFPWNV
jgi:hypothetical protein